MLSRLLCLAISLIFMASARADKASGIDQTEVTIGDFAKVCRRHRISHQGRGCGRYGL